MATGTHFEVILHAVGATTSLQSPQVWRGGLQGRRWPSGASTTTTCVPTRPWAVSRLRPRAGRPSSVGAQRPARSQAEKNRVMKTQDSPKERGIRGAQTIRETAFPCVACRRYSPLVQAALGGCLRPVPDSARPQRAGIGGSCRYGRRGSANKG